MITRETALAAIEKSKAHLDAFGAQMAFHYLSQSDQKIVRDWFHYHAKGFATLNSVVYAVANDKLEDITQ